MTMTLLAELSPAWPVRYYVGLDVGYREHVVVAISLQTFVRGDERWQRARCLHFASTRAGLRQLQQYLDRCSPDPRAFLGLCEPTGGYYGASVSQYLLDGGYRLLLVDNGATRHMREKIFGALPKTDDMDARVMARMGYLHEMVGEEFSLQPLGLPAADEMELVALCRTNWKLNVMVCRLRNQFGQLVAMIFPELKVFFTSSVTTVAPVSLVRAYPSPGELAGTPAAEVAAVLRRAGAYEHALRVDELQALAADSSGLLPDPGRAWRLAWLTDLLQHCFVAQASLDKRLAELVVHRDDYRLLASLPYGGIAALGVILAVTRDVVRFSNYRQYVAYTGYFAGLEKSQTIDHTRMSKRGNRDLKRALFQIAAPLVWFDPRGNPYKALYERKKADGRPWYKAMPFACAALARHIYHCLKFKEPYDINKVFQGSAPRVASEPALLDLQADLEARFEVMDAHSLAD